MNVLLFCRDGILRRSMTTRTGNNRGWTTSRLAVRAWEASVDENIFLKTLHDTVVFEDGLTVGELFTNLEPWAKTMTGIACMDFPAFLSEIRQDPKPDRKISEIILALDVSIMPVPKFDRSDLDRITGKNRDKAKRKNSLLIPYKSPRPKKTGLLYMNYIWSMTAMLHPEYRDENNGETCISLSHTELFKWQHVPIKFKPRAEFHDETAYRKNAVFLGTRKSLTKSGHQNVRKVLLDDGRVREHCIDIESPEPTFFDAVIRGFLWDVGFFYSPIQRDQSRDKIIRRIKEIDAIRDADESANDDITGEAVNDDINGEIAIDDTAGIAGIAGIESMGPTDDDKNPSEDETGNHEEVEKDDTGNHKEEEEEEEEEAERQYLERIQEQERKMGLCFAPDSPDTWNNPDGPDTSDGQDKTEIPKTSSDDPNLSNDSKSN